jgi:NAD(P)-dependent dehydrogenase (short-subunit alcohol dehydrogenase family)
MKDLEGKAALVTGGGSGIGRATALALAEAGAAVVIADIDGEAGAETVRAIEGSGGRAAFVRVDVTRAEDLERMASFAEETFGRLDVFHNNAGINTGWPRFPEVARERWEKTVAVNLTAVIGAIQAVLPLMRRSGGGAIVNSASLAGLLGFDEEPIYAATKHGVVGLTRSLAFLKDEAGVRVNCVCPGFVDTPLPRRRLEQMPAAERARWEEVLSRMPMLAASEIAEAVLELVRDETLAGAVLAVMYGQPRRLVPAAISVG